MLKKIVSKIFRKSNNQDIQIIPTAPIYNDNVSVNNYANILNAAINNKNIHNLAIMGSYGTGKSTIIKNYKERYNKKRVIDISTGTFLKYETDDCNKTIKKDEKAENNSSSNKDEKAENNSGTNKDEKAENNSSIDKDEKAKNNPSTDKDEKAENNPNIDKDEEVKNENSCNDHVISQKELDIVDVIEKSILKQIINLNYNEELPKSTFKRINRKFDNYIHIFSMFFIVISAELYILFEKLDILKSIQLDYIFSNCDILKAIILFIMLLSFAYEGCLLVYNIFSGTMIDKIKLRNYELDIKKEDNKELTFTKQIIEIMYFFGMTKYNVVFFEDIDRFPNDITMKVLEELKELNLIINNSKIIKRKVTFVYTVKDGIFKNAEQKSKFFDYTISVMPIISKYNSLIILKQRFEEAGIKDINESVLNIISRYIFDIRTIINIINDYTIFSKNLYLYDNDKKLDIAASDKVLAIIAYKNYDIENYEKMLSDNNFIDKAINEFEQERKNLIAQRENNIKVYQNERVEKNAEIKKIKKEMIDYAEDNYGSVSSLKINNEIISTKKFENEFKVDDSVIYFICDDAVINEDEIFSSIGYKKQDLIDLYSDIDTLIKKEENENDLISKILEYEKIDYKFLENNKFLKDLIMSNFIAQDYVDYITLPVEGSTLTPTESKFIFGVSHNNYYPNIKFKNYKNVIDYLKPESFSSINILNYDLVNYLINNRQSYTECYENLIGQFKFLKNKRIEFLYNFSLVNEEGFNQLLKLLVDENIDLFTYITKSKYNNNKEYKEKFVCSLLKCVHFIETVYDRESLKQYINNDLVNNSTFNSILNEFGTVLANLILLEIRFIDISKLNKNNISLIYENNLYKFTPKNLKTLFGDCKSIKEMNNANSFNIKFFKEYVYNSFQYFYSEYYLNSSFKINDEQLIKKIVTNQNLAAEQLKNIYSRENFIIKVSDVKLNLYDDAISYNHIEANWTNIKYMYNLKNGPSNQVLMDFIKENKKLLFTEKNINLLNSVPDNLKREILNELLKIHDIDSIKLVAPVFSRNYHNYNLKENLKSKWKEIIELNLVKFDEKNFRKIKLLNDTRCKEIYLKNWYESINDINRAQIPNITIIELLKCKFVSKDDKFKLLYKISKDINADDFNAIFKNTFLSNYNYEIVVSNRQWNKIFTIINQLIYDEKVKKKDKYNSTIEFCVKSDIKKMQVDNIELGNK